jgi:hypothetical protein
MAKLSAHESIGQTYGLLTVIRLAGKSPAGRSLVEAVCSCEGRTVKTYNLSKLKNGHTKSCGCEMRRIIGARNATDENSVVGTVFGRLTILSLRFDRRAIVLCKCECGKEKEANLKDIRSGKTRSCGCGIGESTIARCTTHGQAKRNNRTSEHGIWSGMKSRCYDSNSTSYPYYGARGITVCDRWINSFENFYEDMGPKPGPEYSIDRIDVNGNYEPGNVRWATPQQQAMNRRNTVLGADRI